MVIYKYTHLYINIHTYIHTHMYNVYIVLVTIYKALVGYYKRKNFQPIENGEKKMDRKFLKEEINGQVALYH